MTITHTISSTQPSHTHNATALCASDNNGYFAKINDGDTPKAQARDTSADTPSLKTPPSSDEKLSGLCCVKSDNALVVKADESAANDPDSFLSSRYYRLYQLDKTIGELEDTTADLASTLESVANKRQSEADKIKENVENINKAKDAAGDQLTQLSNATKSFGLRMLKTAALTGTAIGSLMMVGGLAKAYLAASTVDRSLSTSSLALASMGLYQLYNSPELSIVTQAGRSLLNNVAEMSQSGMALFNTVANTGAAILEDVGDIAQVASRTSNIANKALKDVRGT